MRLNRIVTDWNHPFDAFDVHNDIITITDDIEIDINISNRLGSSTPLLQVLVTLRYYASRSFEDVCGELIGVDQSTVSRTVTRVTEALLRQVPNHVGLPNEHQADRTR